MSVEDSADITAAWRSVWQEAFEALLELVPEANRDRVRKSVNSSVEPDAPRMWLSEVAVVLQDVKTYGVRPEPFRRFVIRLKSALVLLQDQCWRDPAFFPSPVGMELWITAKAALLASSSECMSFVWPAIRAGLADPEALGLPEVAIQRSWLPFEVWSTRFRRCFHQVAERWYRPMLSGFYRMSRLGLGLNRPEISDFGQLLCTARDHWRDSPLAALTDDRLRVLRNSEAHGHTEIDLATGTMTFMNRSRSGETTRWSASAEDLELAAREMFRHGELMRNVLCVVPFSELDADSLVDSFLPLLPEAAG